MKVDGAWAGRLERPRTLADLAWAAGVVDGEGCIHIATTRDRRVAGTYVRYDLRVSVANIDPRMCLRLRDLFGGGLTAYSRARGRPYLVWAVSGARAVQILHELYPFLVCKQDQAEVAFAWDETRLGRGRRQTEEGRASRQRCLEDLKALHTASFPGAVVSSEGRSTR